VNINTILERLSRLPRIQRVLLYALSYVLITAVYVGVLYLNVNNRIGKMQTDIENKQDQLVQIQQRVAQSETFEVRLQQLVSDLKVAMRELPEEREIPDLLKKMSSLGKKVGLEVRRFAPLAENMRQYVAEMPMALEVEGGYHEVAMFFDRLSKMNRIVYVKDIEMTIADERGGKVYLDVTGNVVTFRFLSDSEIERQKKKINQKGKR